MQNISFFLYILAASLIKSLHVIVFKFNFSISVLAVCLALPIAHPKYPCLNKKYQN